jgi:hypothetical protein
MLWVASIQFNLARRWIVAEGAAGGKVLVRTRSFQKLYVQLPTLSHPPTHPPPTHTPERSSLNAAAVYWLTALVSRHSSITSRLTFERTNVAFVPSYYLEE